MTQNAPTTFNAIVERIRTQKTMLLPAVAISAFALVGYAAADRQAPVIHSNKVVVPYGTKLNASDFEITDNRDNLDIMDVSIQSGSYESKQLGTYSVTVSVTDTFKNTTNKEVEVQVIDNKAPVIASRVDDGYIIDVEANGSNNLFDYVKATDNVDGDVSDFITFDGSIDTAVIGEQRVVAHVEDNAGNKAEKTLSFNVKDSIAPVLTQKTQSFDVNYGETFNPGDYFDVSDNFDPSPVLTVKGDIDTKKLNSEQKATIIATDNSGNETKQTCTFNIKDIKGPEIKLNTNEVSITEGTSVNWRSLIVSAIDNLDGDLTKYVGISGNVDVNNEGCYTATYTATDKTGNTTVVNIPVEVKSRNGTLIQTALGKIGCRYKMGAVGPNVFDCSSFTRWVYRQNGRSLSGTAAVQYNTTQRVDRNALKPGDLVFFKNTYKKGISHVGIYLGGGRFVHAANEKKGVITSSLSESYYAAHYAGGGRV